MVCCWCYYCFFSFVSHFVNEYTIALAFVPLVVLVQSFLSHNIIPFYALFVHIWQNNYSVLLFDIFNIRISMKCSCSTTSISRFIIMNTLLFVFLQYIMRLFTMKGTQSKYRKKSIIIMIALIASVRLEIANNWFGLLKLTRN